MKIPFFNLSKREKIIITAIVLALGLLFSKFIPYVFRFHYVAAMTGSAYILSLWALWEGMNKLKAIILLILPTLFTLAVSAAYLLLLVWWAKLIIVLGFGVLFYTLLLSQNIFNVSSARTIPLYRVASTVAFIITIFTATLLFNDIYSFNLLFIWNGIITFILAFILALQIFWSLEMESLSKVVVVYSLVVALVVGEVAMAFSFWPVSKLWASIAVAESLFIVLAVSLDSLREKLSRRVVWQYLGIGAVVFAATFIFTSWTG